MDVIDFVFYHGARIGTGLLVMLLVTVIAGSVSVGLLAGWEALTRRWPFYRTREMLSMVGAILVVAFVALLIMMGAWELGDDLMGSL